jgi:hypothetical protein
MEPTATKIQNHVSSLLTLTGKWKKLKADAPAQTSGEVVSVRQPLYIL